MKMLNSEIIQHFVLSGKVTDLAALMWPQILSRRDLGQHELFASCEVCRDCVARLVNSTKTRPNSSVPYAAEDPDRGDRVWFGDVVASFCQSCGTAACN